mmetsp:Transcript_14204/g.32429  ORF Transcript_14204/g.32429 Transcript_14204/m.32429 type:complete len:235 (-) Transcript_14204:785-1489(-)
MCGVPSALTDSEHNRTLFAHTPMSSEPVWLTARSVIRGPRHACTTSERATDHKKTFLSTPADTKCRPSGSHAHAVTVSVCFANVRKHSPVCTRHSFSSRSAPHVSRHSSSGLHATNESALVWPLSTALCGILGARTSQTTTMRSFEADASISPLCENLTNHTSSECFSRTRTVSRGMSSAEEQRSSKSDWPQSAACVNIDWLVCQRTACCSNVCSRCSGSKTDGGMCGCSSCSS